MKRVINTPEGLRTLPEWATCYCVKRHTPTYIHPLPFSLPQGEELWLCPNTYSQVQSLLGLYEKLDGPPNDKVIVKFSPFARNLIRLYWNQVLNNRRNEEYLRDWEEKHRKELDAEKAFMRMVSRIKRAEL